MNTAIWTLWLIVHAPNGPAVVTPIATYQTQVECYNSFDQINGMMKKAFGPKNPPSPGLMFCVEGKPAGK